MISPSLWLSLKKETREVLARELNIPRSKNVEVVDNRVVCDGHSVEDLYRGVTLEKLQEFVDSKETDVLKLFGEAVKKVENPETEPPQEINTDVKPKRAKKETPKK